MKKKWTIRDHVRKRARQRYDVDLTTAQLLELAGDVLAGRAVLMEDQGSGTSVWRVLPSWSDEPIPVVFCARRNEIVTVLPQKNYPCVVAK